MQTVRSSGAPKSAAVSGAWRRLDGSWNLMQVAGDLALILAIIAFGTPFFIVNGSLSVTGLGLFLKSLGSSGHLAWAALTVWQVELLKVEGLPPTQPVLPWLGVISASVCQIVVAWMRRTGTPIPQRLMVMTWILSIYDLATTFNGTSAVAWIARYGLLVQVPASLVITFTFEVAVGVLLAIVSNAARRE